MTGDLPDHGVLDDMPEDAMQLTQIVVNLTVVRSTIKETFRKQCQKCALPPDADDTSHEETMQESVNSAKASDMPMTCQSFDFKGCQEVVLANSDQALLPAPAHATQGMLRNVQTHSKAMATHDNVGRQHEPPVMQTQLTQFFKPVKRKPTQSKKDRLVGQTTISDFFNKTSTSEASGQSSHAAQAHSTSACHVAPKPDPSSLRTTDLMQDPLNQFCSAAQEVEPPVFATSQALQPPLPQPRTAPRPAWRIHLANIFEEVATVIHRETGPVIQVEVWYIHHQRFPDCPAPRALELDNIQELWYADLCNLWFDRVNRHEPLKVLNVLPNPPFQARPRSAAHIILEQGFSPQHIALHFTAIFLGGTNYGFFQRVESAPPRICTRDMIARHGFQLHCDFRPCNMHSGYIRFQMDEPEEVFSGISAVLTVAPPPAEPRHLTLAESRLSGDQHRTQTEQEDVSMMQHPPNPRDRPAAGTSITQPVIAGTEMRTSPLFDHRMTPAAITEFRATLSWQLVGGWPRCEPHASEPLQVHTWFLHSDNVIRTEECRTVSLTPQAHTWHEDIIQRWQDKLDNRYPVQLHVVTPNPPGQSLQVEAHVIVLQKPNPLWRSALLTVTYPATDPWHIHFICAMLDVETDMEQLSFISGVGHPANPDAPHMHIEARHGQAVLRADSTFPVRHGYWFDIQAVRNEIDEDDDAALIQLQMVTVKKMIQDLWIKVVHPDAPPERGEGCHQPDANPQALTVTVFPNEPNLFIEARDALSFFNALQAYWQPLALLQPPERPAMIPVVTWYLDHIRHPQCFQPRFVLLNENPEDWIQRIRSAWMDLVLPQHLMHIHVVQLQGNIHPLTIASLPRVPLWPGHLCMAVKCGSTRQNLLALTPSVAPLSWGMHSS